MLEIRNITIVKKSEDRELIRSLSFTMHKNDKYAIIGIEGSGKSSLIKSIYGTELEYIELAGSINYKKLKIGYLPQSIRDTFENENVLDFILKDNLNSVVESDDYRMLGSLDRILKRVKFNTDQFDESKTMNMFSGGEVVKLGLAKVLLREPDILLLDEPTNDLDLETVLFIEDFIINEERPILYISHDERLLENTANGIIHLTQINKNQKAMTFFEKSGYIEYKQKRNLSMDSQEMVARKQRSDYKKKVERFRQIYQKVEHQQNQAVRNPSLARLLAKKMKSMKSMEKRMGKEETSFLDIPERADEINLFFDKDISIPNKKVILDYNNESICIDDKVLATNINLTVKGPQKLCIIGENGTGKSTLLRKIVTDLSSVVNINVGYMPQNYDELIQGENTLDFIMRGRVSSEEGRVRKMLGALHFTREEMLYSTESLSGGQKAKLILLKIVLDKSDVLILDEPTRNLSPLSIPVIHNILMLFKGTIISVSHDRSFIENVFDDVLELRKNGLFKARRL